MPDHRHTLMRYADEVWNSKRLGVADEIFTEDHVYHDPLMGDLPRGPEGVKARVNEFVGAFPDAHVEVHDLIVQGDLAAARWTWGGTNIGEILGMPPTGMSALITGMHFFRMEGGRIAETWVNGDTLGLLQQLGMAPAPAGV